MDRISPLFEQASQNTIAGNFQAAINAYQDIMDLTAESEQAYHLSCWGIGEIYLNNRQISEAVFFLSKAVELAPRQAHYQYLLGCAFTYENSIDRAIYHLEFAIDLDDSIWQYWNQLGWVVGFNKDVDQGIEFQKKALALNPQVAKPYRDLSVLYSQKQNWNAALLVIEEAIAAQPEDEENHQMKAQLENFRKGFAQFGKSRE
jgi:tetratricopeptide (TPR) repeat protein